MPPTVLQIVTAVAAALAVLISFSALIVAVKSLRTARRSAAAAETSAGAAGRSAAAAESNAAVASRAEQRQIDQQHDADGPRFEVEPAIVDRDRTAEVRIAVVGGPRRMVVTARSDDDSFCRGVSAGSGAGSVGDSVIFPPVAPGAVLTMTVHLTTDMWSGHAADGEPLALLLDVESREPDGAPERTWQRAAQVILRPPGPPPMSVPTRPEDRLPDRW